MFALETAGYPTLAHAIQARNKEGQKQNLNDTK